VQLSQVTRHQPLQASEALGTRSTPSHRLHTGAATTATPTPPYMCTKYPSDFKGTNPCSKDPTCRYLRFPSLPLFNDPVNAHDTYVDKFVFQKFISMCCRPHPPPPSVCLLTASGGGDRPPAPGHPPLQRPTPKDIPSPQQAKEADIAATAQYDYWDIPGLLTLVAKSIVTSLNANAVDQPNK
jgi:hypothetical protein